MTVPILWARSGTRFLRDPDVYLEDIEHYAGAAIRFTSGLSLEQYLADEKTCAAVERVLEVCGEAITNFTVSHSCAVRPIPRRLKARMDSDVGGS